ncbi:MAG: hypothetical protein R3268_00590 [Acidiferrobacterales bacterium]|nr:hypothetical protein [Acidiferrobacterales bacterium]
MRRIVVALLLTGLIAPFAAHAKHPPKQRPEDIPSGSTFKLRTTITVTPANAVLYFQDAQLIANSAIQPDYVYCTFQLDNPPAATHKIEKQVFTVTNIDFDEREIGNTRKVTSVTTIHLDAKRQTENARMACQWPEHAPATDTPTADEISGALGKYFTLKRAP